MRYSGGWILCLAAVWLIGCGAGNSGDQAGAPEPPVPTAPSQGGSSSAAPSPHTHHGNPHTHTSPHASSEAGASSEPAVNQTGPFRKEFAPLTVQVPQGWQEVELKPIQRHIIAARFKIPTDGGEAELTCSIVGGKIPENVARWHRQFGQPPPQEGQTETVEVDDVEAAWVDLSGTFTDIGPAGGTKENWRMLGVAVPLKGEENFYFKLTGPQEAVGNITDEFRTFIESIDVK